MSRWESVVQNQRVGLVGLAGKRRQSLDPLGVGDLDVPALLLERVVDHSGAGHRFDDGADGLVVNLVDSPGERSQRVDVRRDDELVEVFSLLGEQADVDLVSTQI